MVPPKSPRLALDRTRIGSTALAMVDARGLESLTMRALAEQLSCDPMSLYRHVSDRDDLLRLVASMVIDEIAWPNDKSDDRSWLIAFAHNARTTFHAHPFAMPLIGHSHLSATTGLELIDALVERLARNTQSSESLADRLNAFVGATIGYVTVELSSPAPPNHDSTPTRNDLVHLRKHAKELKGKSFAMRDPSKIVPLRGGYEFMVRVLVDNLLDA